ncbi:MAG: TetR/AcrR family transcriptional regulator [Thermoleophilaceae bacterium]
MSVIMSGVQLRDVIETGGDADVDEVSERILDGALGHFEEFGLRRTTMEDVARRVGVSRVTVYRRFAGKEALVEAVILRELQRFFTALDAAVGAPGHAEEQLAEGFAFALEHLRRHPLVTRLLTTEPESLLPHLTLDGAPAVTAARRLIAERIGPSARRRGMSEADAEVAAELLARLVLSFLLTPDTAAHLDTTDDARRFARRYLAPAMRSVGEAH